MAAEIETPVVELPSAGFPKPFLIKNHCELQPMKNISGLINIEGENLASMLEMRASDSPSATAYIWLPTGEEEAGRLSYGDLSRCSKSIATELQGRGRSRVAALLYPPGLDFISAFFACMYAGLTAVPLYLPRAGRETSGLRSILADCAPSVILTSSDAAGHVKQLIEEEWKLSIPVVVTNGLDDHSSHFRQQGIRPGQHAYIQYTSGSTDKPKGVMISHRNVLSNMEFINEGFLHDGESAEVCWLPVFHDMGLVYGILQPVFSGFPCILMPPAAFIQSPLRWLAAISKYRATHSGGPNFGYELCARFKDDPLARDLDLSCWRVAFNGAEPVRADTLDKFHAAFSRYGFRMSSFYPAYGLAESTLKVSGGVAGEGLRDEYFEKEAISKGIAAPEVSADCPQLRLVSCGRASHNHNAIIVHPETLEVMPECRIGEIWIDGPSVGSGYLNNAQETEKVFRAFTGENRGPFLRSGDLGFFHEGHLFVTGRLKDIVVIRGKNFYPHDIESAVEQGAARLKPGSTLAFSIQDANTHTEELVLVVETRVRSQETFEQLAAAIRNDVITAMGLAAKRIIGVLPGELPRTSSGKLRRAACKSAFIQGTLQIRFSSNIQSLNLAVRGVEKKIVAAGHARNGHEGLGNIAEIVTAQICEILQLTAGSVDAGADLAATGMDSIGILQLAYKVQQIFGIRISPADILECRTVTGLAGHIKQSGTTKWASIPNTGGDEHQKKHRLGYSQLSLLYRHHLSPESDALNVARVVDLQGTLREDLLEEALEELAKRNCALRSVFPGFPEEQIVAVRDIDDVSCSVQSIITDERNKTAEVQRAVSECFDLRSGPLFRIRVIRTAESGPMIVLALHHAICDLWSLTILFDDLWSEYSRLAGDNVQRAVAPGADFGEYASEEEEFLKTEAAAQSRLYWKSACKPELPALTLCNLQPEFKPIVYMVAHKNFVLSANVVDALKTCARTLNMTLADLCFGLFQFVMHYYSGLPAFRIGTSVHGRSALHYARTIGCLVNILPVSAEVHANWKVNEALARTVVTMRSAAKHGDYPFYLNLQQLTEGKNTSPAGFIEMMFNFYKTAMPELDASFMPLALGHSGHKINVHGVCLTTGKIYQRSGQHQMTWSFGEHNGELLGTVEWATELFENSFIQSLVSHFCKVITQLPAKVDATIGELLYASDEALRSRISSSNDTKVLREDWRTLQDAFERQASLTPQATAVISEDGTFSYSKLNEMAQAVAGVLQKNGAGAETIVGICAERSLWAVIAMLAVLKTDAAYMPLDPEYPDDRIAKIIAKSGASIALCTGPYVKRVEHLAPHVTCFPIEHSTMEPVPHDQGSGRRNPDNVAYVIFTSGSTGAPKGVMITHRAICNRLQWMQEKYQLSCEERVLQKSPYTFDVSVWEVFWPLLVGATMVIARPGGHRDPAYLADLIDVQKISTLHFVPSMLRAFQQATEDRPLPTLHRVICSGEALAFRLATEFCETHVAQLENLYGPTEAAVDVTSRHFQKGEESDTVSIGNPISNVEVYVLDEMMYPIPDGRVGELYLGGVALARGYIANPGMTAERFLPDPYSGRPGERLYQTGDLVRYDNKGRLQFIGRKDNQVKVRGQRVELGEIEAAIRTHPEVRDCCVRLVDASPSFELLVAYMILEGNEERIIKEVRQRLSTMLPSYMVPSRFMPLTAFPVMPNGKLDHKQLALPVDGDFAEPASGQEEREPDPLEVVVLDIWREVLNVKNIGLSDSFFALGGHSLAATQVMARLRKRLAVQLPLSVIFSTEATVANLAKEISLRLPVSSPAEVGSHSGQ